MYMTCSWVPAAAISFGRYPISRCLPTDGPYPAEVTRENSSVGIDDALAIEIKDGFVAPHHVTRAPSAIGLVLDGQRHALDLRSGFPGFEIRLTANEIGGFDSGASEPRLNRVVFAFELSAHQAITLFEPTRGAVDTAAGRTDAEFSTPRRRGHPIAPGRCANPCRSPNRYHPHRRCGTGGL